MAYMSQEKKKELAPAIKAVLKKYNVKGTIAVRHHSTLVVNIKSGPIDFLNSIVEDRFVEGFKARFESGEEQFNYQVNTYWIADHWTGTACEFLLELKAAMMTGNHDRSDVMTDYFDVGWYIDINIGRWDKPYEFTGEPAPAKPSFVSKQCGCGVRYTLSDACPRCHERAA